MRFSTWILAHGDDLQVWIFFALLPLLAIAERLVPRRQGPMDRRTRWPTKPSAFIPSSS